MNDERADEILLGKLIDLYGSTMSFDEMGEQIGGRTGKRTGPQVQALITSEKLDVVPRSMGGSDKRVDTRDFVRALREHQNEAIKAKQAKHHKKR